MKKKTIALLCAVMSVVMLGGCGSGNGSGNENEGSALSHLKTDKYVTMGQYKGIEITPEENADALERVEEEMINLAQQGELVEVDREAQLGDTVNIDYVGTKDGVAFDGGTAQGYDLVLGSHSFINGFEDGLVGALNGEERDLDLTFPDPYPGNDELSGAAVVFHVTVNSVKEPVLTDEVIQSMGVENCNTIEEYREYLYNKNIENMVVDKFIESSEYISDPPQEMIDEYYNRITRNLSGYAASYGMDLATMISTFYGKDMETFEAEAREDAKTAALESILLQSVANAEGIKFTKEEVDAALEQEAVKGGYASVDALKEAMGDDSYEDYLMCQKVMVVLRENAVINK